MGNESACCCLSASRHYVFEKHPDALNCTFLLQCTIKSKFAQTKLKSGIIKSMRLNRIQVCVCNIWQKIFQNTREKKLPKDTKKTRTKTAMLGFCLSCPPCCVCTIKIIQLFNFDCTQWFAENDIKVWKGKLSEASSEIMLFHWGNGISKTYTF